MLSYILPFIVLIVIVVFIHEYGHYYFAKIDTKNGQEKNKALAVANCI